MDIYLNILIIILAIIGFLIYFYFTSRKNETGDRRLPLNKLDLEIGEIGIEEKKLGVDQTDMYEIDKKQTELKNTEKLRESEKYPLKSHFGENFLRLMIRDPEHLFLYWEINDEQFFQNTPILRLFNENNDSYNDIEIDHQANNWYVQAQANCNFWAELGYLKNGIYHSIIKSNQVKTPPKNPSSVIDDHWMTIEELSEYRYRIEMDSYSMMKTVEGRKILEELEANSWNLVKKE